MIDPFNDELLAYSDVQKKVAVPVSRWQFQNWYRRGVRGRKLEIVRVGGRCYTTEAALKQFFDAQRP